MITSNILKQSIFLLPNNLLSKMKTEIEIAEYRKAHAGVTFSVNVRDREAAEAELGTFKSDIALVFEPIFMADFQVQTMAPQTISTIMRPDHPLAKQKIVRLANKIYTNENRALS